MNWIQTCYGSNILDIDEKTRKNNFDAANAIIDLTYETFDLKRYLASPPFTNPINTSSIPLQKRQQKNWCEKFFA
jgi:hypothetical protein